MKTSTITIKFKDGTEMEICKTLLTRKSEYFVALFRSGMKETINNCLHLRTLDTNTTKRVMNFLINDEIQLDLTNVVRIMEVSIYFEIPSLQEKCFQYLSTQAVHFLTVIVKLSELFNRTRLATLAFQGAAMNFQIAINQRYNLSLDQLHTVLASEYLTISSEYDLAIYIVTCIQRELKYSDGRGPVFTRLIKLLRLGSMPIHCLLTFSNWPPIKKNTLLRRMVKEAYLYHMLAKTVLPLKRYLLPRKSNWSLFGCNENVIEQINLVWPDNDKTLNPDIQLKTFSARGEIRQIIWAYGFLYVFCMDGLLRFDPLWDRWIRLSGEDEPVEKFALVLFEDHIYKIGGQTGFYISPAVEKFSPRRNSWSEVCPLNNPMSALSAVVFEEKMVISGGLTSCMKFSKEVFSYDYEEDEWQSMTPMKYGRYGHQSIAFNNRLYVFGGTISEVRIDEISEVFNPSTNQWTLLRFDARFHFSYIWAIDDYIFTIEGYQTSRKSRLARIDLKANKIIGYEEPLPFTFDANIKYMVSKDP